jgi:hypothetical protein
MPSGNVRFRVECMRHKLRAYHSDRARIIDANEQVAFPSLLCDRYPAAGHPLPGLLPHRRIPDRQPE